MKTIHETGKTYPNYIENSRLESLVGVDVHGIVTTGSGTDFLQDHDT
jgi:hypothetical protein